MFARALWLAVLASTTMARSIRRLDYIPFGAVACVSADGKSLVTKLWGPEAEYVIRNENKTALGDTWFESPIVRPADNTSKTPYLLVADLMGNRVYKWQEGTPADKPTIFMEPSGCYRDKDHCDQLKQMRVTSGSNGMAAEPSTGLLIVAEQGERRIVRLHTNGSRTVLASTYQGKRFNAPNDVIVGPKGDIYFTDPCYGLPLFLKDPARELNISGVFRIPASSLKGLPVGEDGLGTKDVQLVHDGFLAPNGIALSPDSTKLYVGESILSNPSWHVFDVKADGSITGPPKLLAKGNDMIGAEVHANDGIKVDKQTGNIYAGGPGVFILSPEGKQLGYVPMTYKFISNQYLDYEGGYNYMASGEFVVRVPLSSMRACDK